MRQQLQEGPDDLKALLRETNKLAKDALEIAKKTRRSLRLMQWMSTLKLLLILAPIVAAFIFLPPLFDSLKKQFGGTANGASFFDLMKNIPAASKNIDPKLLEEFLKK